MTCTRVYRETSEGIKMQGGGGGGRKKQCGFIGAHKQAAGQGDTGEKTDLPWSERIFSPLHSFLNVKSGTESHESGRKRIYRQSLSS